MRHLVMPVLAAVVTVLSTAPVYADLGDQLFKLLAEDGAAIDRFAWSIAISGSTGIVGAWGDDDNGNWSGSAYLFDVSTGRQIAKLLPDDGAAGDLFGFSVAIGGATGNEIAIVGAVADDDNGFDSGSAYLFDISDPANPVQIAKLLANDGAAGDDFGISVGISGDTAIVGARWDDDNGPSSGSTYVFDTTTGQQLFKLLPDDGTESDYFGYAVALSGTTAIVGAAFRGEDNGPDSGSAYLFDTTTGRQIAKLLPDDGAASDWFGWSVAISGETAIVGAHTNDDNGSSSGSAYLFDTTTGQQIAKLLPGDGAALDLFGNSVAISGSTAIVGAVVDDDNGNESGSAYLFDISDPANPMQIAKLLANDGATEDRFGHSVSISDDTAIIGAILDDDNGDSSGSAYLFDAGDTTPCPWDLDSSGTVGTVDLLELFAQWGTAGSADFDGSGAVNTADLLILFANWGPCKK